MFDTGQVIFIAIFIGLIVWAITSMFYEGQVNKKSKMKNKDFFEDDDGVSQ